MNLIEKCSSPIGDGNRKMHVDFNFSITIEKCSSPIGDGNILTPLPLRAASSH